MEFRPVPRILFWTRFFFGSRIGYLTVVSFPHPSHSENFPSWKEGLAKLIFSTKTPFLPFHSPPVDYCSASCLRSNEKTSLARPFYYGLKSKKFARGGRVWGRVCVRQKTADPADFDGFWQNLQNLHMAVAHATDLL